ncbi:carboxypeptidase regulatory-like domain-containing protein [Halorubellus sp. JP-L1]|uniref:Ig-like domain-containing protein n=1 Tax=Halorubellus sp. JP-L1 TaxID=2715753 RepID=UPI00140D6A31|nr:Ig-like domain-containing protein [Halorubellus sp. JP-L1]NHN41573.1 carboxypeptidase regulatory-like domain-containing protein [Halorubellus sp. JP-L1]
MRFDVLGRDDRAIEGLPIRLVIALVVGVASLSVMMNMLAGVGGLAAHEVDARPTPSVVAEGESEVTVRVVDDAGDPVENATVVLTSGSADLDGVVSGRTGEEGRVKLSVSASLAANREQGTVEVSVKPPASGGYTDDRENEMLLVVEEE